MQQLSLDQINTFFVDQLPDLLQKLKPDVKPIWGNMTPQHMVEHLTWAMDGAMERWKATIVTPAEKLPKLRAFLYSNIAIRPHFQHPAMPQNGELPVLQMPSLDGAIEEFWQRWAEYEQYRQNNPNKLSDHVVFGTLNHDEWRFMHFKHVVHHLSQFGVTTVAEHGLVMPEGK